MFIRKPCLFLLGSVSPLVFTMGGAGAGATGGMLKHACGCQKATCMCWYTSAMWFTVNRYQLVKIGSKHTRPLNSPTGPLAWVFK